MNINEINKKQYVEWKVKPVMSIKNSYGFRIVLIMSDGTEKIQQKSGFATKGNANKERNNVIAALTNRTYIVEDKIKTEDYLKYWLENVMKPNITHNTYVAYSNSINKYIIPKIGNSYLINVNRGHINKLYKYIYERSKSGVLLAQTIMKTAFNYAVSKNIMETNPVLNAKLPKDMPKKAYRTLHIDGSKTLTLDQVRRLIDASVGTKIHMQIIFGVLMGLRRGEINGLKYSDIDYINRTIKIERQLGIQPNTKKEDFDAKTYTKQEIGLKTKSSYRELDIPDYVFEEILKERKKYEKNRNRRKKTFQDLDYICCSAYGRPRSKSYASTHYKKLLKENDLPDIRWHDLRATYATILLKNNYNPKAVSKLMGHAKEIITVDIYGDKQKIIEDCLEELEPFIMEVIPKKDKAGEYIIEDDYAHFMQDFYEDIKKNTNKKIKIFDYTDDEEIINIIEEYIEDLNNYYTNFTRILTR